MKQEVMPPQEKPSIVWIAICFFIKWLFILSWRFFTGAFMDGETKNDGGVFREASKRGPAHRRTWWKRKSRWGRAKWRHAIFWPIVISFYLWEFQFWTAVLVYSAMSPAIAWYGYRQYLKWTHTKVTAWSDGKPMGYWSEKLWWRRFKARLRRQEKKPGRLTTAEIVAADEAVSVTEAQVISAEVVAEGGQPPTSIKRYRPPPRKKVEW